MFRASKTVLIGLVVVAVVLCASYYFRARFAIPTDKLEPVFDQVATHRREPKYSPNWSPIVSELTASANRQDKIEKARKAGLRVIDETEINGDRSVEFLDPVTGETVLYEHIIIDRFPLPRKRD